MCNGCIIINDDTFDANETKIALFYPINNKNNYLSQNDCTKYSNILCVNMNDYCTCVLCVVF